MLERESIQVPIKPLEIQDMKESFIKQTTKIKEIQISTEGLVPID